MEDRVEAAKEASQLADEDFERLQAELDESKSGLSTLMEEAEHLLTEARRIRTVVAVQR